MSWENEHTIIMVDEYVWNDSGTTPQMNARPAEPLFVNVPPKPQRLLHSDAYIRYDLNIYLFAILAFYAKTTPTDN